MTESPLSEAYWRSYLVGAFIVSVAVGICVLPNLVPSSETVFSESPVIESPSGVKIEAPVVPQNRVQQPSNAPEPAAVSSEENLGQEASGEQSAESEVPASSDSTSESLQQQPSLQI